MTREEAIEELERLLRHWDDLENDKRCFWGYDNEAVALAIAALHPVSREQVERVWRGEWMALDECSNEGVYCKRCKKKVYRIEYANEKMRSPFCPACGAAQTDEAVETVMERMEALYGET